jgi:hypothetical protein
MNDKKAALLQEMLLGYRPAAAAERLGISVRTAQKWAKDPDFQAELRAAVSGQFEESVRALIGSTKVATETLVSICADTDIAPAVRVSAAKAILENAFRGNELVNTEARISELEAILESHGQSKP